MAESNSKVISPKVPIQSLKPVELEDVSALVNICKSNSFLDCRDKALVLFLLDTGARAREVLRIEITDLNLVSGEIVIQHGKGGKPRTVFLGRASRRAMLIYLKKRQDIQRALWVTDEGERLSYGGLRGMLVRRANQAAIRVPSLHSFRRAFALNMLRAGVDIFSLQKLMVT